MWAMQLVRPAEFMMVEAPDPYPTSLGDQEVLIRLLAAGVCGSDLPNFKGRLSLISSNNRPGAAGVYGYPSHEVVGTVVASRHAGVVPGTEVVGWATGMNGLAEYVVTQGESLNTYASGLTPTEAILLQPLTCVLHTLSQLELRDRRVAVIGQGPIGMMFCHAAKHAGASWVTGVDPVDRSSLANTFALDEFVHSTSDRWAANLTDDTRPDVVIEAVGHQMATFHDALNAVATNGTVFYFGVPDEAMYTFPINTFLRRGLTLTSGGVQNRRRWIREADEYLQAHPELSQCVTDVHPVTEADLAYRKATRPTGRQLKVVLDARDGTSNALQQNAH